MAIVIRNNQRVIEFRIGDRAYRIEPHSKGFRWAVIAGKPVQPDEVDQIASKLELALNSRERDLLNDSISK